MPSHSEKLSQLIRSEPLLVARPSLEGVSAALDRQHEGAIYFGTGLCTPSQVSVGLPFDILSMMLLAEKIRRTLGLSTVFHHIADTHAASNDWLTQDEVQAVAARTQNSLQTIVAALQLENYETILSSSFDTSPPYLAIFEDIHTERHEYVRRELADIEWYRQHFGVCVKLGWIIQEAETSMRFDERVFDREYRQIVSADMSFLYVQAGRTFDKERPKAPPYIHIDGESRIVLQKGEDVIYKLANGEPSKKVLKYFGEIINLYDEIVGGIDKAQELPEQMQSIIDNIFGNTRDSSKSVFDHQLGSGDI